MLVKLDDEVVARYDQMASELKQPLAQVIERQLARFADYPPTVRIVPLTREPLQQIERLLGGGQIQTPKHLVDRVRDYALITLEHVELELTPAQKAEIVHRAEKQGKTPEAILQDLLVQITTALFWDTVPAR